MGTSTHNVMLDFQVVKQAASGRWPEILQSLGVHAETLTGRHQPCPGCGGRDRFRWDRSKEIFFCGQGGTPTGGDGFNLLTHVFGWTKQEALHAVADRLGIKADPKVYKQFKQVVQKKKAAEYEEALVHEMRALTMVLEPRIAGRELVKSRKFMEQRQEYMPPPESHWEREKLAAERIKSLLGKLYRSVSMEKVA